MAFSLPNPTVPTNGQTGDATPILQNEIAIAQAIASFDGSQIQNGTIVEAAIANAVNPRLRGSETLASFVPTGCLWSLVSGLSGTMTGGTIYVNGYRTPVTGVGANTFNASNDTYVDIDYLGNVSYLPVSNGGTSPALTANAVRVAKIVTNGSTITSVVQSGVDSNFVQIYSKNPPVLSLTNTVQTYTNPGTAGGTSSFFYINLGGIKEFWGLTANISTVGAAPQSVTATITLPSGFFTTVQSVNMTPQVPTNSQYLYAIASVVSASSITVSLQSSNGSNGQAPVYVFVRGT